MRTAFVVLVVVGLGVLFVVQKRHEPPRAPQSAATTMTPRPASEHNWMKQSLDTTNKVKRDLLHARAASDAAAATGR